MKRNMLCIILILLQYGTTLSTQLIQGDITPTITSNGCTVTVATTFSQPVQTKAYDRANGIFWVGLESGAEHYSVASFSRPLDQSITPKFQPRASNSIINDATIQYLTTANDLCNSCPQVAGVINNSNTVFLLDIQDNLHVSNPLRVFNSIPNDSGAEAALINGIAANSSFIFAAVNPSDSMEFGEDENSGIAVVTINSTTRELMQTAAVAGDSGIKAQQLDNTSSYLRINGDTTNLHPVIVNNHPQLVWDSKLQRLFIGVSVENKPGFNMTYGMRSIVVGQVSSSPQSGVLTLFNIAPNSAFNINTNNIVGVMLNGVDLTLTADHIAIMHASTGPSYLIVHGGNGTPTNTIFALPIVDLTDPTDITQGTLANKNMFNVTTHHFEVAATANADLVTSGDQQAKVGNGPLPLQADQTISDIMVIQDTVYVAINLPQSNNNETGIFYSQAQFDNEGKINSWTPWTKRAWPINGFPDNTSSGQVSLFAVDAVTGSIIAVDGSPQETVRMSTWYESPSCSNPCPCEPDCSLNNVVTKALCDGAYSVLDLDQSTAGIGVEIPYRYTLFGGTNKVAFALVSDSVAPGNPFNEISGIPAAQTVTTNFCSDTTFAITSLPSNSGCVTSLEYSRRTDDALNYFFAGTEHGLFVFTYENGDGFSVIDLDLLDTGIIADGQWQAIDTITDPVISIKTSGNTLYVLTSTTSCATPFYSKVLSISFANDITTMFDESNISIIAQTGFSSASSLLQKTLIFTAIDIIQTAADNSTEQLVIATNNGLFQSMAVGGVQAVTSETAALWTSIADSGLFYGIGAIDNPTIKTTDWPFSAQDACGYGTFEASSIWQLNGTNNNDPFQFVPTFFNYDLTCNPNCESSTTTTTNCYQYFQKINYFWSDGARRFFIISPTNSPIFASCNQSSCCANKTRYLQLLPFNLCEWSVCDLCKTIVNNCMLQNISAFYWVRQIGATGIVLAGTPSGTVALQ